MWNWFRCRVWRRHENKIHCGPEGLFLQCVRCGSRSPGWLIDRKLAPSAQAAPPRGAVAPRAQPSGEASRVIPFNRTSGARRIIKKSSPVLRSRRARRLAVDEEAALLDAARALPRGVGPRLQALIVAALETGCQRGELLALRWEHVDLTRRELLVQAARAKDPATRRVPMSARLAAVLEAAKTEAPGDASRTESLVFTSPQQRVGAMKRAWDTAVLKAYGHEPEWRGTVLSTASRAQLHAIDLQFRDLRHEAAARWRAAGWPRQHVRAMLGHPNASQTDTYRNAARMGLQELMRRFDEARARPADANAAKEQGRSADEQPQRWQLEVRR